MKKSNIMHIFQVQVQVQVQVDLRCQCALAREDFKSVEMILHKLLKLGGAATPQKVWQLADTLDLGKFPNMEAYDVAAISDKVLMIRKVEWPCCSVTLLRSRSILKLNCERYRLGIRRLQRNLCTHLPSLSRIPGPSLRVLR